MVAVCFNVDHFHKFSTLLACKMGLDVIHGSVFCFSLIILVWPGCSDWIPCTPVRVWCPVLLNINIWSILCGLLLQARLHFLLLAKLYLNAHFLLVFFLLCSHQFILVTIFFFSTRGFCSIITLNRHSCITFFLSFGFMWPWWRRGVGAFLLFGWQSWRSSDPSIVQAWLRLLVINTRSFMDESWIIWWWEMHSKVF